MTSKFNIPTVKLNNGLEIPIVGLGTYGSPQSGDREKIVQAVYDAISIGVTHIDTAWIYEVEDKVGEGVRKAIADGVAKREDIFVVTKIWCTNLKKEGVTRQARESLKNLGLDYVDCLLVHWPTPLKDDGSGISDRVFQVGPDGKAFFDNDTNIYTETWPAMEEIYNQGLAKSIGVSNFNTKQIEELMKTAKVTPVTNQVECTPFLPQTKLQKVCAQHEITLTAYSPFGGSPKPQSDGTLKDQDITLALRTHPIIKELADKYGKTVYQILLKFHTSRGVIVIPKTVTKERIIQNADIFDFELADEEIKSLEALGNGGRSVIPTPLIGHQKYPFVEE